MNKVMQTKFDDEGNCWAACVASMLEVPIEEVPEFNKWAKERKTSWYLLFEAWLLKEHRYFPLIVQQHVPVPHIVSGTSPRGYSHSVIYEGTKMIHDPHPEGGGVDGSEEWIVFILGGGKRETGESERAKALRQAAECIRELGKSGVAVQGIPRSISQATREEHAKAIEELMEADGHE